MESIRIGEYIYSLLSKDDDLNKMVGNKIYPIIVENGTTFPFIVYRRSSLTPTYSKDYHCGDSVSIDIICASSNYAESIEIACKVRKILEDKHDRAMGINSIVVESSDEDYIDNAYVQNLTIKLTIEL